MADDKIVKIECDSSETEPIIKKNELVLPATAPPIYKLPAEVFVSVFNHLSCKDVLNVRATSKHLLEIGDYYIRHSCMKSSQKLSEESSQKPKDKYRKDSVEIVTLATELFYRTGFENFFYLCMFPMLKTGVDVTRFLSNFYGYVNTRKNPDSNRNFLYTITVVDMLLHFQNVNMLPSNIAPLHWRKVFELTGPWMGLLWGQEPRFRDNVDKRNDLMVILAEMLLSDRSNGILKKVWEKVNEVYIIGNKTILTRNPKTTITLTVYNCSGVKDLLETAFIERDFKPLMHVLIGENAFAASIHICSPEAVKWGCAKCMTFDIGAIISESIEN
ncbi:uncharacterized protein LOC119662659 [Teleopsis dalmanni]|uniref:uncharacterized protein LOC119662659 n=1 Tax=Teleopsis dalmanni TaxID=139649 RepID=UPI0018CFC39B|nr:uncharacterized protein LOC119662659 [Teleopsis dalmanni]